jgi:hypothetical protein
MSDEHGGCAVRCRRCDSVVGYKDSVPEPDQCSSCGPVKCDDCGGVNDLATGEICSCWVSVEDMSVPELKAIFAADGVFNVETDGRLTL